MKDLKTKVFGGLSNSSLNNLEGFGRNLNTPIKRRRLRQKDVAEAALISLPTLRKALKGDPKVSMGVYLSILAQLQLDEDILNLADPKKDEIGLALAERALPSRVRIKKVNLISNNHF